MEISEEQFKRFQDLEQTKRKQYERQNRHIKENYDRISVTLPKNVKDEIKEVTGMSVNSYINALVAADLKERKAAAALDELAKKRDQKPEPDTDPVPLDLVFDALNPPEPEQETDPEQIRIPGMTPEQNAGIDFRRLKTDIMYQLELLDQLGEKKFQAVVDIFSKNRG